MIFSKRMMVAIPVFASLSALAASAKGQTKLTSGVPVPFLLTGSYAVLENGSHGFVIPVPSDPFQMAIRVQIAPADAAIAVYARCGTDVGGANDNNPVFDTMTYVVNGSANLSLTQPAANTDQNCYVAMERSNTGSDSAGTGGRLTVTIKAMPAGTNVSVSSLANIYLAGQPGGTKLGNLSAPANSPVQATVPLTPGQGLNIFGSGQVGGVPSEGRVGLSTFQDLSAALGYPRMRVPANALVGVFVGDSINSSNMPLGLDFWDGDLVTTQTLYPLLQQIFYIGNGVTAAGLSRVFVVPPGATRLFLASAGGGFNAAGTFIASISPASIPAKSAVTNPIAVPALADLYLIDQPNGTEIGSIGIATAIAPLSTPPQVPITLTAGQNVSVVALDSIGVINGSGIDTRNGIAHSPDALGLDGVFVGDTVSPTAPGALSPDEDVLALAPLLQQPFYIGNGVTSKGEVKTFTVPIGATRLFLASAGGGVGSTGFTPAMVSVNNANAPTISKGGIVTNAGFGAGAIAPGSMVAIFGSNFGPQALANSSPLPTELSGTQVFFNQVPAPLFFVSPAQLVAQVPFELYGLSKALVTVVTNGLSVSSPVALTSFAPAIFTTGTGDPVITDYNTGKLVSISAPASRGDTLLIWATGLGPTVLDSATGLPAPDAASSALLPIQVTLKSPSSGAQVTLSAAYAGLAPGFIALDQINVQIPQNAPTGTVILELSSPSLPVASPVTIGIQ